MWTRVLNKQGAWPWPCGWRVQSPGAQGSVLLESARGPALRQSRPPASSASCQVSGVEDTPATSFRDAGGWISRWEDAPMHF